MTTVQIKRSSVAGLVPAASELLVGQLAVNLADKKLFTLDNTGAVITLLGSSSGGSTTLAGLTDVSISNKLDQDLIAWDSVQSKYSNQKLYLGVQPNAATGFAGLVGDAVLSSDTTALNHLSANYTVGGARSAASLAGKVYFELKLVNVTTGYAAAVGLAPSTATLTNTVGQATYGIGLNFGFDIYANNGAFHLYNTFSHNVVAGDVLCVAYDATARRVWLRFNGGQWSDNTGTTTGNPANGTLGITLTGTDAMYAAAQVDGPNASVSLNFGANGFTFTPPSGFTGPDTVTSTKRNVMPGDVQVATPVVGQLLTYNGTKWINATAPVDFGFYIPGLPTNSMRVARTRLVRPVTLKAALPLSVADADTAATAATTFTIKKNGASIGTVNFAAGATTATFTFASDVSFAAGDLLLIDNQATADTTLSNISITLAALRV